MNKWQEVVDDVCVNRNRARRFVISDSEMKSYNRGGTRRTHNPLSKSSKVYYLGEEYRQTYLTQREVECIYFLMRNYRINEIAGLLNISPRTVEFYIKNIKSKLNVPSREKILEKIADTDLMARIAIGKMGTVKS